MRLFWRTKVALGLEFSPRLNEKRVRGRRRVIGGLISCGDRGLRDLECFCKGFFSEVVAEAEEGDFECCVEGEFSFSGIYFSQMRFLFRVVVCGSNCTLVSPVVRLLCNGHFRFGLRIFVVIYPLFFAVGRAVV